MTDSIKNVTANQVGIGLCGWKEEAVSAMVGENLPRTGLQNRDGGGFAYGEIGNLTVPGLAADRPVRPGVDRQTEGKSVTGTGQPGNTVQVTGQDGQKLCEPDPAVGEDGTWSCTPKQPVKPGEKVTTTQTDEFGRVSEPVEKVVSVKEQEVPMIDPVVGGSTAAALAALGGLGLAYRRRRTTV